MFKSIWIAMLIGNLAAFCQKPEIAPGGLVNAARYGTGYGTLAGGYAKALAPGSIVSIFGKNLAVRDGRWRSGTVVLCFTRPINLQFPTSTTDPRRVVVTTAAGVSDSVTIDNFVNFGIFTLDGSGCGPGVVLNVF